MDITKALIGIDLNPSSSTPLYLQIAGHLSAGINKGILPPGIKLLPERDLANLFKVSRTTAINAYKYLEQQGLVNTKIGSGTYVSQPSLPHTAEKLPDMPWEQVFVPHPKNPLFSLIRDLVSGPLSSETISLDAGLPDPALYPVDAFKSLLAKETIEYQDLGHIPTEGYPPLRQAVSAMLAQKQFYAAADKILISAGSQQGLYLITKILIEPGDYVIVEAPAYLGAIQVLQASGARLLTLPRQDTLPLDVLEDYLIRYRPKLFYTVPTFQNPSGKVMPLRERKELLRLAARHRLIIVEDDPYSDLQYGTPVPPPLKAIDPYNGVLYLGTFSKILFPGLRLGYVIGPNTVINRLAQEKQYVDLHCNNLGQWLLTQYLKESSLQDHLSLVRREYKKRRDAMAGSLKRYCKGQLDFILPEGGFYLWCQLTQPINTSMLLREAIKQGVSFVPGEAFYSNQQGRNEMRLCFATHREEVLTEGIKRLAKVLASSGENHRLFSAANGSAGKPII